MDASSTQKQTKDLHSTTKMQPSTNYSLPSLAGAPLPQLAGATLPQLAGAPLPQLAGATLPQLAGAISRPAIFQAEAPTLACQDPCCLLGRTHTPTKPEA